MNWLKKGDKIKMLRGAGNLKKGETYTIDSVDRDDEDVPYHVTGHGHSRWVCSDQFEPVNEFKVGDRVKYARRGEIWTSLEIGEKGKITKIYKALDSTPIADVVTEKDVTQTVELTSLDRLDKFEVGQIYRVDDSGLEHGDIIKITSTSDAEDMNIGYETICGKEKPSNFGDKSFFAERLTLLTGKEIGEAIRKYDSDHAKKEPEYNEVKRAAKVGELVRLTCSDEDYSSGEICKVIADGPDDNVYIRTKKDGHFTGGSADRYIEQPFSFIAPCEYVVLEPRVKEVKRKAEIGEYIKIVDCNSNFEGYHNGDILKTIAYSADGAIGSGVYVQTKEHHAEYSGTDREIHAPYSYALDYEYVVLEGYKPEQKAPAKAKVGDTIQITKDCGGPATPGKSGKVMSVSEDCAFVQLPPHIGPMFIPYGIEHGSYKILSSGKHSYTAEQIAEAKRIVLDTIREQAEQSTNVIFDRIGLGVDNWMAHIAPPKLSAERGKNSLTIYGMNTGTAKCSSNDEPNEWIGKCVALRKALHKPIPAFIMGDGKGRHFDFEKAKRLGHDTTCEGNEATLIHCKNHEECVELSKVLDGLGYVWCATREKLTERFYEGDMTYEVYASVEQGVANSGEGKATNSVEFSDCFTED